jgi:hypothetical protein
MWRIIRFFEWHSHAGGRAMRKRRRYIAHWLFLAVGIVLLLTAGVVALPLLVAHGLLSGEWQHRIHDALEFVRQLGPTDAQIKFVLWLGGIAGSIAGAAITLLVSWHFAEMNLPQRLEDLAKSNSREHLRVQPKLIAVAQRGVGSIPNDIETSRVTLLRKWMSRWNEKEQVRILAASSKQLAKEASALAAATHEVQQRQITSHLIRGYQYASEGEDEKAFEEFELATTIRRDNVLSRDIAAGWARRLNKQRREMEILEELQNVAREARLDLEHARALRRQAELLDKRKDQTGWKEARDRLKVARNLLQPLVADVEVKHELGRVLTLFCEVQYQRGFVGRLGGPNGCLAQMLDCVSTVTRLTRPSEPDGEVYGAERAVRVEKWVADLQGDPEAESDDNDEK